MREPLLHFLLIGIGLFVLFHAVRGGDTGAPREILVSEARVEALAENFAKTWMRPPTAQELEGLVDDYVAEEIYYREGVAMGLDRDDIVIRRRLRQKMEFISEDAAAAVEPTEAQLQGYLAQHAEKFVYPPRLSFRQVFFSTERRGEATRAQAEQLLARLKAGRETVDPTSAGDPTLLPEAMDSASPQAIASAFGTEFAEQIDELPVGQWSGPLQSGFGLHLVIVDRREAGSTPSIDEIRPIVLREWQSEQRTKSNREFLAKLRAKYEVRIAGPAGELFQSDARAGQAAGGGSR